MCCVLCARVCACTVVFANDCVFVRGVCVSVRVCARASVSV